MGLYTRCGFTESWNHSMVWVGSGLQTHLNPKWGCHPLNHIPHVPWPPQLSPCQAPHDLAGAGLGTGTLAGTLVVAVLLLELLRVWQSWGEAGEQQEGGSAQEVQPCEE